MQFNILKKILEAALLAASSPMSIQRLAALFEESEGVSNGEIARALEVLAADCTDRGVELVEVASGYRYQVRQEVHDWVAKIWTERPSRYSRALLETLALIAYRQPITRGEIEAVRGVSVATSITKTLEEREWIRVVGHRDVPGRPALFGTTREFLDYFNLKSLDELPSLAEIRDMEAFDPELNLDGEVPPARAAMPDQDAQDEGETEPLTTGDEASGDAPLDPSIQACDDEPQDPPIQAPADEAPAPMAVDDETAHEDSEEKRA